jgi:hypothetical protein
MTVPTANCSPTTFFKDLMMVVDTNLGGSFTEGVWAVGAFLLPSYIRVTLY